MDFPTLGLNFDLDKVVAALSTLDKLEGKFDAVGEAAERTGSRVQTAMGKLNAGGGLAQIGKGAAAEASGASAQVKEAMERVQTAVETGGVTLTTSVDGQAQRIRDAVNGLFAGPRLAGADRSAYRAALQDLFRGAEQSVEQGGVNLVTLIAGQSDRIRAAVAGLFAPDAARGAERSRIQAQLEATFSSVQEEVDVQVAKVVTYADVQRARVSAALQELMNPAQSTAAGRAQTQRNLEAAFSGLEAEISGQTDATIRFAQMQRARMAVALQELTNPAAAMPHAARQADLEAAFGGLGGLKEGALITPAIAQTAREAGEEVSVFTRLMGLAEGAAGTFGGAISRLGGVLTSIRRGFLDVQILVVGLLGSMVVEPIIHMTDAMTSLQSRLALYADQASSVPTTFEQIYTAAQRARVPLEDFSKLITRLIPLVGKFGGGTQDALNVASTVSKALTIQGASPQEQQATLLDVGHLFSTPKVNGRELRTLETESPVLLGAISAALKGVNKEATGSTTSFIELAKAGKITGEQIYQAILAAQQGIEDKFSRIPATIGQSLNQVKNAITHDLAEVNIGTGFGNALAQQIQGVAAFLDKQSTIDAMVTSVRALGVAFQAVGTVVATLVQYLPVLIAGFAGFGAALGIEALSAWIVEVSESVTAIGLLDAALGAGADAVLALSTALDVLATATPLIVLTALGVALGAVFKTMQDDAGALDRFNDATKRSASGLQGAADFLAKYKVNTGDLDDQIAKLTGTQAQHATTTDEATAAQQRAIEAAQNRVNIEAMSYEQQLRSIAADDRHAASSYTLSNVMHTVAAAFDDAVASSAKFLEVLGRILQATPGMSEIGTIAVASGTALEQQAVKAAAAHRARVDENKQFQAQLLADAATQTAAADKIQKARLAGQLKPTLDTTKGTHETSVTDDPTKGLNGAINAIAKLRAEVEGLDAQINAVLKDPLDPLADLSARIIKAGNEAAAKYTAGKAAAAGFGDQARSLAQLKEFGTATLELAKSSAKEQQAQAQAADQARVTAAAYEQGASALQRYYASGSTSSDDYLTALNLQAAAEEAGQIQLADLAEAQKYGVKSTNDITAAVLAHLPPQIAATQQAKDWAAALQRSAQAAVAAKAGVIGLTEAQKADKQATDARTARLQQISDLEAYTRALNEGEDALASYLRQKAANDNIARAGRGGNVAEITRDTNTQLLDTYNSKEAERLRLLKEQTAEAALSSHDREIEAAAVERARAAVAAGVYPTYQTALAAERIKVAAEASATDWAKTAGTIKDDLRNAFIQTGKLDFSGVEKDFAQAIRQAVYDELLAKPIDIVVNAAVKIEQQLLQSALQSVLGKIGGIGGEGGIGSLISGFGQSGLGISQYLSAALPGVLQKVGVSVGDSIKAANIGGQIGGALASAGIGATAGSVAGSIFGVRQNTGSSVGGAIGGLLGGLTPLGPLGAVIGGILGNVVGSLLGGKPTNAAAVVTLDKSGAVTSVGGSKRTDETTKSAQSAAQAIAQGEQALRQAGLTLGATVTSIDLGVRDTTHIILSNGQRLETAVGDAQAAATAALQAIVANSHSNDQVLDDLIHKMAAAGDSIQDVATAIQNYSTAQAFVKGLGTAALQYTDPQAYAVSQLKDQQAARRTQLQGYLDQGYVSQAQFTTASSQLDTLEGLELKDTLSKFADAVTGATHSLADFQAAQKKVADYVAGLNTGSNSPLSPVDLLNAAGTQFNAQLGKAQGGDYDALSGITDNASTYLSAAQRYYGSSSAYSAIFDQVEQALDQLSTATLKDPVSQTISDTSARVVDAINSGAQATVDAIQGTGSASTSVGAASTAANATPTQVVSGSQTMDTSSLEAAIAAGTKSTNAQLAKLGEAVVGSNDEGYRQLDSTISRGGSTALSGGRVSQAA